MTQAAHAVGSIVWVKLTGGKWWPGEVVEQSSCPEEVTKGLRKVPLAIVKFFEEDYYETIRSETDIYPFVCPKKNEFIRKGRERLKLDPNAEKFDKDVSRAKLLCGVTEDETDYSNSFDNSISNHFEFTPSNNKHTYGSAMVSSSSQLRSLNTSRLTSDGDNKTFDSKSGTDVRIRTQLSPAMSIRSFSYACDLCGFQTSRQANIIVHQKSHSDNVKRLDFNEVGARGAFTDEKVKRKKDAMKKCSRKFLTDSTKTPKLLDKIKTKSKKQSAAKEQVTSPLSSLNDVELSDKMSTPVAPNTTTNTAVKRNSVKAKLEGASVPKKKRKELDPDSIFDKIKKQSMKKTRKRGRANYMGIGSLSSSMKGLSKRKDGSGGSSDEEEFLISRVPIGNEDAADELSSEKQSTNITEPEEKANKDSNEKVTANNEKKDKDEYLGINTSTNILDIPLRSSSDDLMMSVRADVTSFKPGPILLDDDEDDQPESKIDDESSERKSDDDQKDRISLTVEKNSAKEKLEENSSKESSEKMDLSEDQLAMKVAEVLSEDVVTLPSWASTGNKSVVENKVALENDEDSLDSEDIPARSTEEVKDTNTEKIEKIKKVEDLTVKKTDTDKEEVVNVGQKSESGPEEQTWETTKNKMVVNLKPKESGIKIQQPEVSYEKLGSALNDEDPMEIDEPVEGVEEVVELVSMDEVIVENVEDKGIQEEILEIETSEIVEENIVSNDKIEVANQPKEISSNSEPSYVELLPMEILAEDSSVSPSPPASSLSTSSVAFTPFVSVVPSGTTISRAQPSAYVVTPTSVVTGPSLIPITSSGLVTIKTRPAFSLLNRQPAPVVLPTPPPLPASPPPPPPPPPPSSPPPQPPPPVPSVSPPISTYDIPVPPTPDIEYSKVEQQPEMEPVYYESVETVPMIEGEDIIQVDNEQVIESSMDVFCNEIVIESDDKDCQEEYETICGDAIEVCTEETVCGSDTSRKIGDTNSIDTMNGATLVGEGDHP